MYTHASRIDLEDVQEASKLRHRERWKHDFALTLVSGPFNRNNTIPKNIPRKVSIVIGLRKAIAGGMENVLKGFRVCNINHVLLPRYHVSASVTVQGETTHPEASFHNMCVSVFFEPAKLEISDIVLKAQVTGVA
jgi:hypothetical protein